MKTGIKFRQWLSINFIGWFLGAVLLVFLSGILDFIGIENMQFYLGLGMGLGVSLMQWWYLKSRISLSPKWILYACVGMGIVFIAFDLLPIHIKHPLPYCIVLGSAFSALLQSKLLPDRQRTLRWTGLNILAWSLATLTVFAIDYTPKLHAPVWLHFLLNVLLILLGGVVMGVVTWGYWARRSY